MADNRAQIYNFIDANITDPIQKQNTAAVMRAVLKYIVQNAANLADDELGVDPNPAPRGVAWTTAPTLSISGITVSITAAVADFNGSEVTYPAAAFEAALAADGMLRVDAVYGKPDGTYGFKTGAEGPTGVTPTIPTGTLIAGYAIFNSQTGTVTEPNSTGVTMEQVLSLLGDYLPLANPEGNSVYWGTEAQGGEMGFFEGAHYFEGKRGINFAGLVGSLTESGSFEAIRALFQDNTKLHLTEVLAKSDDSGPYMEVHLRTTEGSTETDTVYQFRHTGITQNGVAHTQAYLKALPGYAPNKALKTDASGNFYWADSPGSEPANTPPTLTLAGDNPMNLTVGDTYTEPGYSATDAEDGALTAVITGTVDTSQPGTYTLTYTATDSGGLTDSADRTVFVEPAQTSHTIAITSPAEGQTFTAGDTVSLASTITAL